MFNIIETGPNPVSQKLIAEPSSNVQFHSNMSQSVKSSQAHAKPSHWQNVSRRALIGQVGVWTFAMDTSILLQTGHCNELSWI